MKRIVRFLRQWVIAVLFAAGITMAGIGLIVLLNGYEVYLWIIIFLAFTMIVSWIISAD